MDPTFLISEPDSSKAFIFFWSVLFIFVFFISPRIKSSCFLIALANFLFWGGDIGPLPTELEPPDFLASSPSAFEPSSSLSPSIDPLGLEHPKLSPWQSESSPLLSSLDSSSPVLSSFWNKSGAGIFSSTS